MPSACKVPHTTAVRHLKMPVGNPGPDKHLLLSDDWQAAICRLSSSSESLLDTACLERCFCFCFGGMLYSESDPITISSLSDGLQRVSLVSGLAERSTVASLSLSSLANRSCGLPLYAIGHKHAVAFTSQLCQHFSHNFVLLLHIQLLFAETTLFYMFIYKETTNECGKTRLKVEIANK